MTETIVTTSDGVRLRVGVEGDGPPLLLIHGFPLSARLWDAVTPALAAEFRVIAPDLRGHGASEASETASMARYATDLVEVLHAIEEPGPVVVVGLSMGGYIALELLRRHPGRVRALVLMDTRAGADPPDAAQARRETAERVLREGSWVVGDTMVEKLFAPGAPADVRERWRSIMAASPPLGVAAALRAMAARPDSFPTLAGTDRPVLVVVGKHDSITPVADARRMAQAAPLGRLAVVAGAGHMTPVEQPERLVELLREFLRDVATPPAWKDDGPPVLRPPGSRRHA